MHQSQKGPAVLTWASTNAFRPLRAWRRAAGSISHLLFFDTAAKGGIFCGTRVTNLTPVLTTIRGQAQHNPVAPAAKGR
eukprot:1358186-Amorphochlora_amoeboformis.AAC.2